MLQQARFLPHAQTKGFLQPGGREWLPPPNVPGKEGTEGGVTAFRNLTSEHKVWARRGRQGGDSGKTAG